MDDPIKHILDVKKINLEKDDVLIIKFSKDIYDIEPLVESFEALYEEKDITCVFIPETLTVDKERREDAIKSLEEMIGVLKNDGVRK